MRKNRTKHEAKKPRLAKRALALCFALIFVCSCLLPVFAHSEEGLLEPSVSSEQSASSVQSTNDPVLLNEGGEDSALLTEGGEEPKPVEPEQKPAEPEQPKTEESKDSTEEPKTEGTTEESKGTTEETKNEGTTESKDSTEQQGNEQTKPEEPKTEETKPEEPKQPTTNTTGDTIEQGKATYTYRFWPDKIDAFELEAINDAVKSGTSLNDAAQSQAGMVPCTVLTVMTNANLRDYQANVQQPTKSGYEFAGWYTVDGTTEDEFSFEQSLNFEESKTIDVFAKWNELKAVKSDALSNGGMTVEAKVGPMANVKSVALAEPNQSDAEKLRNSIDKQLYDQSYMVAIFDITPKDKDGMDVEPQNGESVNVEISGLDFSAGDNVWVYHLTNSGRVETLSATVTSDGGVAFVAKSFSPFAVVKLTEGVVGFGTEDDRLATADLNNKSYEMTVGESKTLYGEGQSQYYSSHTWESSKPNVVTVTGNDYSATVEAKSAGTAVITHSYSGLVFSYSETTTITVTEDTSSYPLYVYAKMSDTVKSQLEKAGGEALSINAHGWFTLGKVEAVQGIGNPENSNAGQDGNPKLKSGTQYDKAVGSLENIQRYGKNAQVNLDDVSWKHTDVGGVQFGLTTAAGATDYGEDYQRTWHLDGYIESLSAVVVNYYIDRDDGTQTSIRASSKTHLGSPGRTYTLTKEENLRTIPYEGRMYELTRMEPTTGTQTFPASGKVATINLYYGLEASTDTMTKDTPYINVEKRFTGITEQQIPDGFKICIGSHTLTKNGFNPATVTPEGDDIVLRWKLDGVDVGTHRITEEGTTVPGYELGKVTGVGDTVEVKATTYTITAGDRIPSCKNKVLDVTVKEENGQNYFMVISTTGSNTNIILSANKLSASQRAAIADTLKNYKNGPFSSNTTNEFYSIKENTHFTIAGAEVTYNKAAGTVTIHATEYWNQVLNLSCATDEGKNPEVKIENPYTPATTSLTVSKKVVEGNAAAPAGETFKFKLTVGNAEQVTITPSTNVEHTANTNEWTFTLQDGHSVTISGIRLDDKHVSVEEVGVDNTHYTTKHSVNGTEAEGTEATVSTLQQTSNTVVFTNTYNVPNLKSMTIKKVVTGEFGDRDKSFTFKVELKDKNGNAVTGEFHTSENGADVTNLKSFTLKHGEQVTLGNIPIGTTITVTETDADEYKTKATDHGESKDRIFVYEVVEGKDGNAVLKAKNSILGLELDRTVKDNAITVTNRFDGNPDTGVLLDTLPYLILLAVAVAGGVLVVVRKRKHRDE
mgnify:CR=1 FL=1